MRRSDKRATSIAGGIVLVVVSTLGGMTAALLITAISPATVHANTWGNTDQLESGDVPGSSQSCISSPIWGTTAYCVSQRYGCTNSPYETPLAGNTSAPVWTQVCAPKGSAWNFWHPGIDILVPSGTALNSPVSGVVAENSSGIFGVRDLSGRIVYLIHGYTAQNLGVNSLITVGQYVVSSDSVVPSGGSCVPAGNCAHVHLEVHSSRTFAQSNWDDINPEAWLQYQGPHAAMVSWSSPRIDLFIRGTDAGIWHRYTPDDTNWGPGTNSNPQWEQLGSGDSGAAGQPTAASWGPNRLDIFMVGYDGGLWHKWWDNTLGWQPSQTVWQPLAQYGCNFNVQLIGTPSSVAWNGSNLSVFARGLDGSLNNCFWNGMTWTPESQAYGIIGDPTVIAPGGNRLDVFMLGFPNHSGHAYHQSNTALARPFNWTANDWQSAPDGWDFVSQPEASSYGSTSIDAFATSAGGNLYNRHFDGSNWSGWQAEGNPGTFVVGGVGVADFVINGNLETSAFSRGADGHSYVCTGTVGTTTTCTWSTPGGIISNDPASISIALGEADVIARGGPSGSAPFSVWHIQFVNVGWGNWSPFLGVMA